MLVLLSVLVFLLLLQLQLLLLLVLLLLLQQLVRVRVFGVLAIHSTSKLASTCNAEELGVHHLALALKLRCKTVHLIIRARVQADWYSLVLALASHSQSTQLPRLRV